LLALDGLEEGAVVAAQSDGFEGTVICCAYVPAPGSGVTAGELRQRLAARLPPYMLPTRWRAFARLPRNANGKIGRRELEEAFARHEAVAH
jgi:acyl-coenzyme A synthetase/AMP-(fatty) acid ligase